MPTRLTFDEIRSRFEEEKRRAEPPRTAKDLPLSYESIPPEWFTDVLAGKHPGAAVTSVRLSEADEGTSSRRRIFLEWNDAGKKAGLPSSVFCKATQNLENRYIIGMNGGIEAEITFYNRVRPVLSIEAPRPLFASFDPRTLNSIVVLEDMTDEVEFGRHDLEMTRARAESQMRLLATFHGKYYESPELSTTLSAWNTWEDYFAITVEEAGFGQACLRGFEMAEKVIPPSLFRRAKEIWPATLKTVARHAELPRTFIHSDPHLKNWYVAPNGQMGLNDWQCSCKGNWGRDVAYAMSTALTTENRRAWERDLLALYLDALASAGGGKVALDDAWTIYRQNLFSALSWWTGTLGQPSDAPAMQPPETSLVFIGRMTHAIDDLDALAAI